MQLVRARGATLLISIFAGARSFLSPAARQQRSQQRAIHNRISYFAPHTSLVLDYIRGGGFFFSTALIPRERIWRRLKKKRAKGISPSDGLAILNVSRGLIGFFGEFI